MFFEKHVLIIDQINNIEACTYKLQRKHQDIFGMKHGHLQD